MDLHINLKEVDPFVKTSLRRFIYIVADHVGIKNLKISNNIYKEHDKKFVTNNKSKIEKIKYRFG